MKNVQADKWLREQLTAEDGLPENIRFDRYVAWQQLDERLSEKQKKKNRYRLCLNTGIAAAVLLLIVTILLHNSPAGKPAVRLAENKSIVPVVPAAQQSITLPAAVAIVNQPVKKHRIHTAKAKPATDSILFMTRQAAMVTDWLKAGQDAASTRCIDVEIEPAYTLSHPATEEHIAF